MTKAYATYQKRNGQYTIELTINGEFAGGGEAGTTKEMAYDFASKVAYSKGARLERFAKEA